MQGHRPRHIRDIAHLYLSRQNQNPAVRKIVIFGNTRDDFPGFHAANLAVAFARAERSVRLLDLSGLVPDSAYFLALPPEIALDPQWREKFARAPFTALAGVRLSFSLEESDGVETGAAVDVLHAPISALFSNLPEKVLGWMRGADAHVCVARGDADIPPIPEMGGRGFVVHTSPGQNLRPGWTVADPVSRWRDALTDRVPAAIRDPGSILARRYEQLRAEITTSWREAGTLDGPHGTARTRPG